MHPKIEDIPDDDDRARIAQLPLQVKEVLDSLAAMKGDFYVKMMMQNVIFVNLITGIYTFVQVPDRVDKILQHRMGAVTGQIFENSVEAICYSRGTYWASPEMTTEEEKEAYEKVSTELIADLEMIRKKQMEYPDILIF